MSSIIFVTFAIIFINVLQITIERLLIAFREAHVLTITYLSITKDSVSMLQLWTFNELWPPRDVVRKHLTHSQSDTLIVPNLQIILSLVEDVNMT